MSNKKFVIFDFCGTLIKFQTADNYVNYCVERLNYKSVNARHVLLRIMDVLRVFKVCNRINKKKNWRKMVVLWQLRGVKYEELDRLAEDYLKEKLLPNVVLPLIDRLREHIAHGERVCILSGGYDIYISKFAQYFGIEEVIASKIAFKNEICLGRLEGLDCMGENKLTYIRSIVSNFYTICYTDSISDLPLLKAIDKPIVVSSIKPQEWAKQYLYEQIIWN